MPLACENIHTGASVPCCGAEWCRARRRPLLLPIPSVEQTFSVRYHTNGAGGYTTRLVTSPVGYMVAEMSETPQPSPQQNHLLAALPKEVQERVYPFLELAEMPLGRVLYESGVTMRHVYFPTDAIISLLYVMESGASAEIAVVGNEGLVGLALFMGGESTTAVSYTHLDVYKRQRLGRGVGGTGDRPLRFRRHPRKDPEPLFTAL